jgi:hypothetical protein
MVGRMAFAYSSGACSYPDKVRHAVEAGAQAVVVFNDDPFNPEALIVMEGDCATDVCSVPAVSVSYYCGTAFLTEPVFREPFALVPIRVTPPVAVEEAVPEGVFSFDSLHPNPASLQTVVELELPSANKVRVAVFDVLGRRVAVLHDGPLGAGAHRLRLDASALPAGVYVVRAASASHGGSSWRGEHGGGNVGVPPTALRGGAPPLCAEELASAGGAERILCV